MAKEKFPVLRNNKYPDFPEELKFLHVEEILDMYPDLPRRQWELKVIQAYHPTIFINGIGQSRSYMYLLRTAHLGEVT